MPSLKPLVVRETRPGPDIRDDVGMLNLQLPQPTTNNQQPTT
jgi:hypothetical protein